jgi:hypothetical protein
MSKTAVAKCNSPKFGRSTVAIKVTTGIKAGRLAANLNRSID